LKKIVQWFVKYKIWLLALLKPLGVWGVGCIALLDAAAVPVPMDLILAGYVWANKSTFYLYVIVASAGSALGGLVPFFLGRAGGELFLMKRIDRARFEQLRARFERQEFLAMMIPSILPPPTPWKLFVFAAGVFEMRVSLFLIAVFVGRVVRDMITAVLVIYYGPEIVSIVGRLATQHRAALICGTVAVFGLLGYWGWYSIRKRMGKRELSEPGV
jgi:membrane protein YqaA with SNARE-associated domain